MKQKETAGREFKPIEHVMVPHHEILDQHEVDKLLVEYNIDIEHLPKIHVSDPAAASIKAKSGNVIRIIRHSPTAGRSVFYRLVIA